MLLRRLFSLAFVIGMLFIGVVAVLADHTLTLVSVTCDPATNTVVVTTELDDPNPLIQSSGVYVLADGMIVDSATRTNQPNGPMIFVFTNPAFVSGVTVSAYRVHSGPNPTLTTHCEAPAPTPDPDTALQFSDGRINAYDAAAPVVVYPHVDEGNGFSMYTDGGAFVFHVTAAMIDAAGLDATIASDAARGILVSRLADGTFQINARLANGKTYILQFAEPYSGSAYTSFEQA